MFHETEFVVDSRSIDMHQQCRPSALLGFLQESATLASQQLHISNPEIYEKYHALWVITRILVELDAPLRWYERFTLRTWHRGAANASVIRDFDFLRDGKPIGQATSVWAMVDASSHALLRMKEFPEFQGTGGGELCKDIRLRRIALPESFDHREQRPMRYSETDTNGHINNIHYADFACDALRMDRQGAGKFVRVFRLNYLNECFPGETISIDTAVRGGRCFARGLGQDEDPRFECEMELQALQ